MINMKNILNDRIAFYLDADGNCHWEYVGMVDRDEELGEDIEFFDAKPNNLSVDLGTCRVCGKNPIKYNYILRNTVPNPEPNWDYVSVGSECIQYLDQSDMLRIKRDQKVLKFKKDKENAMVFGKYLRDHVLKPELWKINWTYFGKQKNLGGSVSFISKKCLEGVALQEKTFGKELRKALKENGIIIPNMKEMKEMVGKTEDELPVVPIGYELVDYYGISPITGQRDIMYVTLKDIETGEEEFPNVSKEWDPVIEDSNGNYIHLQKFIKSKGMDPVLRALKILAGNDPDYAGVQNGIGFNGRDTEFGHSLASCNHLSLKQREYGKKMVRKYHKQLPKDLFEEIYGDEQ